MTIKISVAGRDLLRDPLLNKDTAFSEEEKKRFALEGLLPPNTETIHEQLNRCQLAYQAKTTPLEKHIYLRALQDRNEILFYRFVLAHLKEILPIIYTPVVGEACQQFHRIYRQPRGLFINYPERHRMQDILKTIARVRDIRVIVVTDGERILGLGDQGAGGLGIPIGKLSLYTACGGIHPAHTLPVILDVGTNNQDKLNDPEYLGWRHPRLQREAYLEFVDQFVQGVKQYFPSVLLQFEDFAQQHAYLLLDKYRDQLCAFNDDIQGTASVCAAAILAAAKVTQKPLKTHRIALLGAGSAGCGISEQLVSIMMSEGLTEAQARAQFYLVDREGLLHHNMSGLMPFQKKFVQDYDKVHAWSSQTSGQISLDDVIQHAKPTILLGVSGQKNQFTEAMVRHMASYCQRPIIFPLSNPTSRCEAVPEDLLSWSEGRALVATGSPFDNVCLDGQVFEIAQCNNSYIFPGVGLGAIAGQAKRISDHMMMQAAVALSELSPAMQSTEGRLLPDLTDIRAVSCHIAKAVMKQGIEEGCIDSLSLQEIETAIQKTFWYPEYEAYID